MAMYRSPIGSVTGKEGEEPRVAMHRTPAGSVTNVGVSSREGDPRTPEIQENRTKAAISYYPKPKGNSGDVSLTLSLIHI